jgi:hypothetical protein
VEGNDASFKHLGIDPFAFLREALPAMFGLGKCRGERELACWLPNAWQQRQQANGPPAAVVTPA